MNPLGSLADLIVPSPITRGPGVPLGRPLPKVQYCLLDAHQHQIPTGVIGELYLAGAGLAAGYLNAPELTQERFLTGLENAEQVRWYRTGDLVREDELGQLEFVGRNDNQVKMRGYRIELGEIENQLRNLPGVRDAVVHPWQGELVGYVLAWKQPALNPQEVRETLSQILPSYMVPGHIMMLDQFPLTANGKVDRRHLPEPEPISEQVQVIQSEPARTPIEEMLLQIWQEVLGLPQLGRNDDFFQMGGHSLLGTRVIAQLQTIFGIEVPIIWLFEAPTVAGMARLIEQALRQGLEIGTPPLVPIARQQPLPLSFAQQRLWFLDQMEPGSTAYAVSMAGWLRGPLVPLALEQSLTTMIDRHEVLRTTFALHEGLPVQVVHPTSLTPLRWIDLTGLPEPERSQQAIQLATQEIERPFDLQRGPLLRTHLLRCSPREHALLLTAHHSISDAWSQTIWRQELRALYTGFVNDTPIHLPALPVQYADYALWQRSWLQGEALQQQLSYWKNQLANLQPLELPTDHPRPTLQSLRGAVHSLVLPETLNTALKQLSQKNGTTLFMTLLAAFQVLLARSSGQNDIAVGTPIANRNRKEVEGLIGFFTNTLVLRSDLSDNPTFIEMLKRVRRSALEAYTHQEIPFEQVVEALQPERDLSRSPLFQVLFQLQHAAPSNEEVAELELDNFAPAATTAKFDLTLALFDNGRELYSSIEYNRDLFEPATIERWQERWQLLLEGLVQDPEQRIDRYELLTLQEHQALLYWNATQQDFVDSRCVHELFADQATRTPDAIAVAGDEIQLSYATLDHLSTQLAALLQQQGVGPETLVGICLERSVELVVSLLGVLKAGGAYVPIDPEYPRERLAFLLADAQISMLLTSASFTELFANQPLNILTVESYWSDLSREASTTPQRKVVPQNPAYVIYTSGSTGHPKGVMISHAALSNHMLWMQTTFPLTPADRVLQKTPASFDASVWEFYAPLLAGACLVLAQPDTHRDSAALALTLAHQQISILQVVPTLLHALLDEPLLPYCHHLRSLFCGGEELRADLLRRAMTSLPPTTRLYNLYGPTEATIDATCWPCEPDPQLARVPIGSPISNLQVYLLDAHLQPVPIGVPGEVFLGGAGLARGYHRRSDLTAEAFLPHPFSSEPGARLYRTGDLARFVPQRSNTLQYLGRRDAQVKLRGYRIEPGEIEAILSTHPAVSAAAVGMQHTRTNTAVAEQRLIAYVVRTPEHALSLQELRSYLGERLPQYMLPSGLVELEQLPLTSSGKVDRRQLATLTVDEEPGNQDTEQRPRNELEELVSQIWSQVLQVEQLGIYDNFFEVGGHSLLATQVVSRLRRLTGVELPVRALFEAPTVAQLATRLTQELQKGQRLQVPEIVPQARSQDLPLSFTQQRLWFFHQLEPDSTAYSIPTAVRLDGQLHRSALAKALTAVIERHENLRTTFPAQEGQPVQLIAPAPTTELIIIDLSHLAREEREPLAQQLAQQEARRPFDLTRGPLLRCWLLQLAEQEEQVLLLTLHHIISDGWSMSILVRELTSFYAAFSQGQTASLPALPVQYADYALWQRSWLQGEVLQRQLDYWKQQLKAIVPLELPIDHPRPPIQTFRGARMELDLPITLHQQLRELSRREGATMFMTLLASFQILLSRYSGQENIAVGTTIANRTHQEIEGLIGCFINMLVLRSDLSNNPSFIDLLAQVRGVALQAYSHQDLPFEQVVEALQPQRDLSRSPLFQVLFVMQNLPEVIGTQTSIQSKGIDLEQHVAKLELSVMVVERGQRLSVSLGYNTDLFEARTIRNMFAHWQLLLEGIVANPEQPISLLPLLTPAEHERMLIEWNTTHVETPDYLYQHKLFEAQVERTPDAIAIVLGEVQLTYQDLNRRANQLAHRLQRLGVRPETRVGICLERSLEMVISLLAVLKAGGAYVPLDPASPRARFTRLLQEVRLPLLLTSTKLRRRLPPISARILLVEQENITLAKEASANPDVSMSPDNLAYIVYTSGSTGRPKGIMIAHRGVANYLNYLARTYHLDGSSTVLQLASVAFDASVRDIFGALTTGARMLMLGPDEFKEPQAILRKIEHHQVTALMSIVPSLLRMLLEAAQEARGTYTSLQLVLTSGEPLLVADCQKVASLMGSQIQVVNQYGPTECTMTSTYYASAPGWHEREIVLVGKPIPGMQAYILDHALNLVPPGIQGDIYLGGAGLARCYLDQAEATAERFLPHPWSAEPGQRIYKTGDIARYLPDGNIELLGRSDHQVKIRGNRVELGEIEAALSWHPQVKQSVILMKEVANHEQQLVAYVAMEQDEGEDLTGVPGELRSFLQERLPDYMLPAHFVPLATLPFTPNGKVDRQALASLELALEPSRFVQFRDAVEYQLRDIWSELLNKHPISVMDNFFDLGGHSILAVRLLSHIKRTFDRELPLAALFQHQTVAELATLLREQLPPEEDTAVLVPFQMQGSRSPFFCVHPAGGEVFEYRNLSRYIGTEQPFYGMRMPDPREHVEEFRSLEGIAAYYIAAIKEVQSEGPYQIGGWSAGGQIAYEMAQQLQREGQEVRLLALLDSKPPKPVKTTIEDEEEGTDDAAIARSLMRRYQLTLPENLASQGEPIEQLSYICDQLKQQDIAPRDVRIEQIRFFAHVHWTIEKAIDHYIPQPYTGQVTLLKASDEDAEQTNTIISNWKALATHLHVQMVPGTHITMIEEPRVKDLAQALAHYLNPEHHQEK
ncbi:hypothetical protein KSC_090790 [Ktedonobacter sp. SOSP1-52]|uniref:non-ribosomal peptide synthetase n=1 Tax=Ktedonobacter sp. SOSP1-52 TaxID=2778366 RepID=UPI00191576FF|nr:non-ribosomal peptide synthetase [Ktedonobacter sp. SOSP1-52]GHO70187.1 hypothetical protein KSC_090790 [Ktedonobacter sp. SOSP1-52]